MNKVKVRLGKRSYEILIGPGILKEIGSCARRLNLGAKVLVITDPLVKKHYGAKVKQSLERAGFAAKLITVPRGEKHKTLDMAGRLYLALVKFKLQRDDTIIALGGGVLGDLAGFVAATYMRGVNLIQLPTTLLAQVDSSVGGKTGTDLAKGKNLVGVFYQPRLVMIDLETLNTLPRKEVINGLAEVVKYGVIKSKSLFWYLQKNQPMLTSRALKNIGKDPDICSIWQKIITACCLIKARVVARDEREGRYRMILNFGHTIGHAVEAATNYSKYSHGEAVAIGMVAASNLAARLRLLDKSKAGEITGLIKALGLPARLRAPLSKKKIITFLQWDKKVRGKKVQFVLPKSIGKVIVSDSVPFSFLSSVLEGVGCR